MDRLVLGRWRRVAACISWNAHFYPQLQIGDLPATNHVMLPSLVSLCDPASTYADASAHCRCCRCFCLPLLHFHLQLCCYCFHLQILLLLPLIDATIIVSTNVLLPTSAALPIAAMLLLLLPADAAASPTYWCYYCSSHQCYLVSCHYFCGCCYSYHHCHHHCNRCWWQ